MVNTDKRIASTIHKTKVINKIQPLEPVDEMEEVSKHSINAKTITTPKKIMKPPQIFSNAKQDESRGNTEITADSFFNDVSLPIGKTVAMSTNPLTLGGAPQYISKAPLSPPKLPEQLPKSKQL